MNTEEVAKRVMELVRKQAWYEALDELYDDNIVSVEAYSMGGESPETHGKEGVRGKVDWWVNTMDVHKFDAKGPFVGHYLELACARVPRSSVTIDSSCNTTPTFRIRTRTSEGKCPKSAFTP